MMITTFFSIFVLIYSAIIHEYMHGWMAERLGDKTARYAGRLTLNPIPHIDPIGSFLLPLILILSNSGFVIGWAKPVPFNPYNLRDPQYGAAKVAAAGPAANFIIALFFGLLLRFTPAGLLTSSQGIWFVELISVIVIINLLLMVFNLMPIPPLDGSKILFAFLPARYQQFILRVEGWGIFLVFFLAFFLFSTIIAPIIGFLFQIITGIKF